MNQLDTQYKKKKGIFLVALPSIEYKSGYVFSSLGKKRKTDSEGGVSDGDDEEQEQVDSESRHRINKTGTWTVKY